MESARVKQGWTLLREEASRLQSFRAESGQTSRSGPTSNRGSARPHRLAQGQELTGKNPALAILFWRNVSLNVSGLEQQEKPRTAAIEGIAGFHKREQMPQQESSPNKHGQNECRTEKCTSNPARELLRAGGAPDGLAIGWRGDPAPEASTSGLKQGPLGDDRGGARRA